MNDKIQDDATLKEDYPRDFGGKLKARREEMGISVSDAASRLHLSPRFITLLENDDLSQSTLPVIYLRGYLRSYSRLLNIPEVELTPVLEKLNPSPPMMDTEPVTATGTESLSIPYPLERNPYYARAATLIISLALLTSITTWWYLHAKNTSSTTFVALEQPLTQPGIPVNEVVSNPLNASNTSLLQTAAKGSGMEQPKAPNTSVDLGAKKPVALATAEPGQALPVAGKPAAKQNNDDDEIVDEQE